VVPGAVLGIFEVSLTTKGVLVTTVPRREPLAVPTNDVEFHELMEGIDRDLRERGVPVYARELAGLSEVSRQLRVEQSPMEARNHEPRPGVYQGLDLTARVIRWFNDRYGERLRSLDPRPGRMAIILRSDVWVLHLPLLIGRHDVVASREIQSTSGVTMDASITPVFNILDAVEGMTRSLQASLTNPELDELMAAFKIGMPAYLFARSLRDQALVSEAISDHESTVLFLAGRDRHMGQARWAALQAAEKMVKSAIRLFGGAPPRTHSVEQLARSFEALSGTGLDPDHLASVQVSPGVRYGEGPSDLPTAVCAHHAALEITRAISVQMRKNLGRTGLDWTSVRPSY